MSLEATLGAVETNALESAKSFVDLSQKLQSQSHLLSLTTSQYMEVYEEGSVNLCDSLNRAVCSSNCLLLKCQQLHEEMKPVEALSLQIKEIKKGLDFV
eukprot:TRINITY_DN1477_c0_g1_i2.p1 TRINITY_DN1477_c0_g1~~TRINITY_DN1477_c0_g1_i2.p1  ORF type:complete len:114 (+),score=29.05 TRINITY_DN1477_c0_g1_i2:47-343(+)